MKGSVVFWCTVYDTLYVCDGKIDVIAVYDGRQYSVVELCAINCCYISNISSILSFFFPILFNKYSTLILKRATLRRWMDILELIWSLVSETIRPDRHYTCVNNTWIYSRNTHAATIWYWHRTSLNNSFIVTKNLDILIHYLSVCSLLLLSPGGLSLCRHCDCSMNPRWLHTYILDLPLWIYPITRIFLI